MNLVVNARDALPDGGEIRISTGHVEVKKVRFLRPDEIAPGAWVRLQVSDDGAGIDPRDLKRIFEPFFTTKPRSQGTGLGLSMVYGAVQRSNGEIRVESEPGEGATFNIYLPRVEGVMEKGEPGSEVHIETVGGAERILVAEDDPAVRLFVEDTLSEHGYVVETAANGRKALGFLTSGRRKVDLLLTDVMMPEMGGIELAKVVTEQWPDLPILFMSGFTDDSPIHALRVDKEARLIDKPFAPETLLRAVREALASAD
jgi:CheY-like chemotaxis protein